jgi:hypothetical protein
MRKSVYKRMFEESLREAFIQIGKESTLCGDCFGKFHYHIFWEPGRRLKQYLCLHDRSI